MYRICTYVCLWASKTCVGKVSKIKTGVKLQFKQNIFLNAAMILFQFTFQTFNLFFLLRKFDGLSAQWARVRNQSTSCIILVYCKLFHKHGFSWSNNKEQYIYR